MEKKLFYKKGNIVEILYMSGSSKSMYRKFGENPTQERYCDEQKLQVRSIPTILCINPRFQGGTGIL